MAKFHVEVIGPNLHNTAETFHVHAVGCKDIERDPRHHGYAQFKGHEDRLEVDTLTEVCDTIYPPSDFDCESGEYNYDFKVFACCGDLR